MPGYSVPVKHGRVFLPVFAIDTSQPAAGQPITGECTVLVDTGSVFSMISDQIVRDLSLDVAGARTFMSANGQQTPTTLHGVALAVPVASELRGPQPGIGLQGYSIREGVVAWKMTRQLPGFDVLLGMDVLIDFRIVIDKGVFTISR